MNLSVILEKKPGHVAPEAIIEHVNKLRGSVSGFAIRHLDNGKPEIDYEFAETAQATSQFMKLQDAGKDNSVFLFFSDKKGSFDTKKDIQPFVLMNGDDAMLAVFVEGDFSKYVDPEGKRSDEGYFWQEFLEPLLIEKAGECSSIESFFDKLRSKVFQQSLINASNHRCVFAFLPLIGEPICFGHNELGKAYEWGNVSDNLDYGVEVKKHVAAQVAGAVAEVGKSVKRKFFSDASPAAEATPPVAPTAPETKHVNPIGTPSPEVGPKTDTAINAGSVWVKPQKEWEKGLRNAWYRHFNGGQLPKNHEGQPAILVSPDKVEFAQRPLKTLNDLKLMVGEMKNGKQLIIPPKDFKHAHEVITKTPDVEVSVTGNTQHVNVKPQNVSDYIPDMNAAETTKAMELAVSFMGDASKRPTLLDLQRIEEAWPKFSSKVGIPLADTMYWTPDQLMQLDKKMLVQLLNEFKIAFRETQTFKDMVAAEAAARQAAAKAVHVAAKEELQPEPQKIAASGGGRRKFFS